MRNKFREKGITFRGIRMMGGLCFRVHDSMCSGIDIDKKTDPSRMMDRIGKSNYKKVLKEYHCRKFDITGRELKGFVFVEGKGISKEEHLDT